MPSLRRVTSRAESATTQAFRVALGVRLAELALEHRVVGAVVAVQQGETVVEAATGVTNQRTGVEVTTSTLFQLGSISKVYTAALVMQLIDEGLLTLQTTVADVLPEISSMPGSPLAAITVEQLLTHTSGIEGDVFDDFGRGDGCLRRYVRALSQLAPAGPPGVFSYCNAGYVVLGRVIEQLRGMSWDGALRQHLLDRIGATDTITLPEEALLRRTAVGHVVTHGLLRVAPEWLFTRAMAPAGGIVAPAVELLAFARMLTQHGRTEGGTQVLSEASAQRMFVRQVSLDVPYPLADSWGLGWVVYNAGTPQVIGHDGSTVGQQAFLRVVPERDVAVTLLVNGGGGGALFAALVPPVLAELAGVSLKTPAKLPLSPSSKDVAAFLGPFERYGLRMEFREDDGGRLFVHAAHTGEAAGKFPEPESRELVVLDERTLITLQTDPRTGSHVAFRFFDRGPDGYGAVHSGGRMTRRATGLKGAAAQA